MNERISVIIPTYNPSYPVLTKAIDGLKSQTIASADWELIIIDNNSSPAVTFDLDWKPGARIIREATPGLTQARLAGFANSTGEIIVMVDDDNVLAANYLENVRLLFAENEKVGAAGGKSIPRFESAPPPWLSAFFDNLALRDLGENATVSSWKNAYPENAPIGAGMALRRVALNTYINKIHLIRDRTPGSLGSGGDNDMVIEIAKSGWEIGYFPVLLLEHLIPKNRTEVAYLSRLLNQSSRSWVLLLDSHDINPWPKIAPWTVPLRKIKAWISYRAWQDKVQYIRWRGACGLYDGLAHKNKIDHSRV